MSVKPVAPGVWLVTGGFPVPTMNVYLIEDSGGGVTMFDAGVKSMVKQLRRACDAKGGLNRIVLGHGHPDHRGAASGLGAPVFCHPKNVAESESAETPSYMDTSKLAPHGRLTLPRLMKHWDGGPVKIADTVSEGDDVSGFKAVDISGHSPGQIALYRESDGLALTSDAFYTLDPQTGIKGKPRLPHRAFNQDEEQTRGAVLKLAEMDIRAAWPGHANPITEDIRSTLLKVAGA